jgi:hypothetical protein
MVNVQHNAKLNQLLIDIGRSLLQYVGQCASWSSDSEAGLAKEVVNLVAVQQRHVAELSDLLMERRWSIDFGGFPASYTDFHFLSLKYLLKQSIINQKSVLQELEEAQHTCVDDPEASALIEKITAAERQVLDRLTSMTAPAVIAS